MQRRGIRGAARCGFARQYAQAGISIDPGVRQVRNMSLLARNGLGKLALKGIGQARFSAVA
jgi:hypothetical protein